MTWWMILIEVVGFFLYLYLSWRNLRENYKEEDVVAYSWVTLLIFLIASRITYGLINWGVWSDTPIKWLEFWKINQLEIIGGYGLWLLLIWLVTTDRGWKYWAFAEDNVLLIMVLVAVLAIGGGSWLVVLGLVLAAVVFWLFKGRYRSFTWYKSGRKGFLFLVVNIVFFGYLTLISGIYWWLIVSLICGVGLVMLGNDQLS